MIYNTIKHDIRNKANLSLLDYCLLESIYLLSNGEKSKYKTWCNAAKSNFEYLASSRTIVTRFNELEKLGWLEFKDESRFLKRTTQKYYEEVYAYILGVKELHGGGEETALQGVKELHPPREETAPNNTIDNTIDNNKEKEREKALSLQNSKIEDLEKQLSESNEKLKALESEKEKEKSSAKKESGKHEFPQLNGKPKAELKTPPHKTDIEQAFYSAEDSANLKPYELAIQNYHFENWTENLKSAFYDFCKSRYDKQEGKFYGTQAKATIREVEKNVEQYGIEKVEKCLRLCELRGWAYDIKYQINQEFRDKQDENKRNKELANDPNISTVEVALRARYGDNFGEAEHQEGNNSTGLKWYEVHQQPEQEF